MALKIVSEYKKIKLFQRAFAVPILSVILLGSTKIKLIISTTMKPDFAAATLPGKSSRYILQLK